MPDPDTLPWGEPEVAPPVVPAAEADAPPVAALLAPAAVRLEDEATPKLTEPTATVRPSGGGGTIPLRTCWKVMPPLELLVRAAPEAPVEMPVLAPGLAAALAPVLKPVPAPVDAPPPPVAAAPFGLNTHVLSSTTAVGEMEVLGDGLKDVAGALAPVTADDEGPLLVPALGWPHAASGIANAKQAGKMRERDKAFS